MLAHVQVSVAKSVYFINGCVWLYIWAIASKQGLKFAYNNYVYWCKAVAILYLLYTLTTKKWYTSYTNTSYEIEHFSECGPKIVGLHHVQNVLWTQISILALALATNIIL